MGWGQGAWPWPLERVSAERVAELEQQVADLRRERDEARAQLVAERRRTVMAGGAAGLTGPGVVVHIDPSVPPMAVATRPQDWAPAARRHLFGERAGG